MSPARPLGILLLALAATACGKGKADTAGRPDSLPADSLNGGTSLAIPVVGETVRKGDLVLTVNATGQIRTEATADLKSETQGTVEAVLVKAGDKVTKGQVLARVDTTQLHLDMISAQAQVNTARVNYRIEIEPDSVTTGLPPSDAKRAYALAHSGLEAAQVALERAKLALARAAITAPYDGVIERVDVAVGDRISAGAAVATIVDLTHLRVEAQVLEHDLPLLHVGGDAFITVAAMPDKPVHGTIAAILPLVDSATRMGRAEVRIAGDGVMRPGMYAEIRLEASRLPNRIIVPTKAIIERDNRPLVFTVKDGRAEWVYITPGRSNTRETEVLPDSSTGTIPLQPGDVVLTEGHLTLSHQAPVKLVMKSELGQSN